VSSPLIHIAAVNVGVPQLLASQHGTDVYSAIAKRPLPAGTALWLSLGNLAGDGQADLSVHGGPDKAVYAYPSEHVTAWSAELGAPLGDAPFGENLSTLDVCEADVGIGDVWRWDDAVLQVSQPRWPCFKLALYRNRPDIQARMRSTGRTGWYLRVLSPGSVTVGSPVEIIETDGARLTVADAHTAMADRHLENPSLVERLARHAPLATQWRLPLQQRLGYT
jgi:MOSC domain-containing protein YiiM